MALEKWIGRGVGSLNLKGAVKEEVFLNLVNGLH
jgi:hypothetical protein